MMATFAAMALPMVYGEWLDMQPKTQTVLLPKELEGEFTRVSIKTRQGWNLACWMATSRNGGTVVLLHGYRQNRLHILPEARLLSKNGFGTLLCDSRAHGESEGPYITYGREEAKDLLDILDWLNAQGTRDSAKIAAYGFSMGAVALVLAAAEDNRISSLALASAPSSLYELCWDEGGIFPWIKAPIKLFILQLMGIDPYSISLQTKISKISPRPILLIHGGRDTAVPRGRMQQVFSSAAEPKELLVLPESAHGDFYRSETDLYATRLVEFYKKTLNIL